MKPVSVAIVVRLVRAAGGRRRLVHDAREGGRVDLALVLELQEQPVAGLARELGREGDRRPAGLAGRVDMEVGEVAFAQRDQMAAGAEVGLHLDWLARAADREAQL